jgi:4-amino-4-deoxy-L-arabinose transferase-like glycosyltransferase
MPVFSTSSSNRALCVVATVGALLALAVGITGGFVIDAGPLRLSVRSWLRPLIFAAVAFVVVGRRAGVSGVVAMAGQAWPFAERHALAMAVILAAAVAGHAVAHGTYAAAGADAGGYVSQADLIASGRLAFVAPLSQQVDWPEPTLAFAPLGYRPGLTPGLVVPTYPPGLPLVLALTQMLAGRDAVYLVAPLLGALAVLCAFALGRRLHSTFAGLVAAALLATSPILIFEISQPMSDVAATAWWALALALASRGTTAGAPLLLAGASAGLAFLTRPVLLPLLIPVALGAGTAAGTAAGAPGRVWWRFSLNRVAALVAGFAPFVIGLALLQQRLYGAPSGSGHGSFGYSFGWENVPPNISLLADRLITGETAALSLAGFAVVLLIASGRSAAASSTTASSSPSPRRALAIGVSSLAIVLLCYLPYAVFYDWSYLRFQLPAFPALFVGIGALVANACQRLSPAARGPVLLTVVVIAGSFNVSEARRQESFLVRRSEARYQVVGQYLESMLPARAVVITMQQSATIHHYARRPIVRWDLIGVDLDRAVADLVALGLHPVLVLEDHEEPNVRKKFPRSPLARLDWRPRADIGDHVRVRVYDPAERATGPHGRTDRIHAP